MKISQQHLVLSLTWLAYVAFNVTRKTTSVVKHRLQNDLAISSLELGAFDSAFLGAYTLGQFIVAPLGDKHGGRVMIVVGLIGTAGTSYLMGSVNSALPLTLLSFLNGLAQSGAFAACIKTLSPWLDDNDRGTKMGIWSTCSPVGGVLGTSLATAILTSYGWRASFQYPAPIVTGVALICTFALPNPPVQTTVKSTVEHDKQAKIAAPPLREVLMLPGVLWLALGYFFLKFMRYLLLFWLPFYHIARLGYDEATAGYLSTSFEIGGVFGTIAIGWISDRFLDGKRTRASMWMMMIASIVLALYISVGSASMIISTTLMGMIGVLFLGPDSVMSGTICQDIAAHSQYGSAVVGTITGFVNGSGSLGSVLQGFVAAWISSNFGWDAVFGLLISFAALTALALGPAVQTEASSQTNDNDGKLLKESSYDRAVPVLAIGIVICSSLFSFGGVSTQREIQSTKFYSVSLSQYSSTPGQAYPACCTSIYEVPPLLQHNAEDLAPGHRLLKRIYSSVLSEGSIVIPSGMLKKMHESGKNPELFRRQRIVNTINNFLPHETMSHNAVRSQRFGNTIDASSKMEGIVNAVNKHNCEPNDFCEPRNFVASSPSWGYIQNSRAILAANMGMYTGSHGLIIATNTSNAILLNKADFRDIFELSMEFFHRAHSENPERRFPVITCDMLHSGGASQWHPHFQAQLLEQWYPGKWEAVVRAANLYKSQTTASTLPSATFDASSGNYFTDILAAHASVGLAFGLNGNVSAGQEAVGFVSMTSASGLEIDLLAKHVGAPLADLFHDVLRICRAQLGWSGISSSCMVPPLSKAPADNVNPVMCRIAYRGSFDMNVADISSNELFATAIVGTDIFKVAQTIQAHIRNVKII